MDALRAIDQLFVFPEFLLTDFRLELPELDICQAALVPLAKAGPRTEGIATRRGSR